MALELQREITDGDRLVKVEPHSQERSAHSADVIEGARLIGRHPYLDWVITSVGCRSTVTLVGELDLSSAEQLELALSESLPRAAVVVFDLKGLEFVDSTGLRVFIRWRQNADAWGGQFLLANVPHSVTRLLEVTGLNGWFEHEV